MILSMEGGARPKQEDVATNHVLNSPLGSHMGFEGILHFARTLQAAIPDLSLTVEEPYGNGDRVQVRWTVRGTHQGEFQGVAPTGKEVEFTGIHISRVNEEGKLQESWENYDALSLMQQIGAIPTPEQYEEGSPT